MMMWIIEGPLAKRVVQASSFLEACDKYSQALGYTGYIEYCNTHCPTESDLDGHLITEYYHD